MRILHVLDHSIPLQSGYTFRTLSLLTEQRRLGWETHHLTTPRHTEPYQDQETVDGWVFHRTPAPGGINLPVLRERAEMAATEARLNEIIPIIKPDILHAHSPVLNALPAIRAGRRHGIPVNYEVRAFWEDAATSHGSIPGHPGRMDKTNDLTEPCAARCSMPNGSTRQSRLRSSSISGSDSTITSAHTSPSTCDRQCRKL